MATGIESVIREELDYIFCYGFNVCLVKNSFGTVYWVIMILKAFVLFFDLQFICFMYSIFLTILIRSNEMTFLVALNQMP